MLRASFRQLIHRRSAFVRRVSSSSLTAAANQASRLQLSEYDAILVAARQHIVEGKPAARLHSSDPVSQHVSQYVEQLFSSAGFRAASEQVRVLFLNEESLPARVGVAGLGKLTPSAEDGAVEEGVRRTVANGVRALRSHGAKRIALVGFDSFAQVAAEGASLGLFSFDHFKTKKSPRVSVELVPSPIVDGTVRDAWTSGWIAGESQNLARALMETPANWLTPTLFCKHAVKELEKVLPTLPEHSILEWHERELEWAQEKGMNAFVSVGRGSAEPLRFLEVHYRGGAAPKSQSSLAEKVDVALVGKGVTFDSGGISIKPSAGMALMKGDMGGAAVTFATILGVAKRRLPVNVSAFIPLCENMPSGNATKPGDVVVAMNGKSIEIDNTDAEGRLILADALYYAQSEFHPKRILDVATLTGAMDVALGSAFTGVFSNNDDLYQQLEQSGKRTGDPVWRMPLSPRYTQQIQSYVADLKNVGGRSAGSCTAAVFLQEFLEPAKAPTCENEQEQQVETIPTVPWAHLDIAGVMDANATSGHDVKGMSGRPVRTLLDFIESVAQK